jgi:hypothetical protein
VCFGSLSIAQPWSSVKHKTGVTDRTGSSLNTRRRSNPSTIIQAQSTNQDRQTSELHHLCLRTRHCWRVAAQRQTTMYFPARLPSNRKLSNARINIQQRRIRLVLAGSNVTILAKRCVSPPSAWPSSWGEIRYGRHFILQRLTHKHYRSIMRASVSICQPRHVWYPCSAWAFR